MVTRRSFCPNSTGLCMKKHISVKICPDIAVCFVANHIFAHLSGAKQNKEAESVSITKKNSQKG